MVKESILKEESVNQLIEHLLQFQFAHLSPSKKELMLRCPFCGDSVSNKSKTSFSLNVDSNSERFLRYQCFRASCGIKGIVDDDFYDTINFVKNDCIKNINEYLIKASIKIGGKYKSRKLKNLTNVINTYNKLSDKKLNYINKRFDLNLTYKDLYNLKINLDLNQLLNINEIVVPQDKLYYYENLSNYGISFISMYNDYVIIRDISKSNKLGKRYTNINIFNNYDNVTKCYCIPRQLDLLETSPCVINITEGAFDIIGVYYHLNIDRNYKNQVFLAACGGGIINSIKAVIKQYGLLNVKINIFSDADVPIEKYSELKKLKPYLIKSEADVYYNTLEKDFGVSKEKIKYIKSKLF